MTDATAFTTYLPLFLEHQVADWLPWYLLVAQCIVESGLRPDAVSPAGAKGLAQFMDATWSEWGEGDVFDPGDSIQAQAKYLTWLRTVLTDEGRPGIEWALAAYCWGIGNVLGVERWDDVPAAVRAYAHDVLAVSARYRDTYATLPLEK